MTTPSPEVVEGSNHQIQSPSQESAPLHFAKVLGESALRSGIQDPYNGLGQLINVGTTAAGLGNVLPEMQVFSHAENVQFGSSDWFAQTIGSGLGMVVPFMAAEFGVGKVATPKRIASLEARGGMASTMAPLIKPAVSGATYGLVFTPTDGNENFFAQRGINAAVGGITFGAQRAMTRGILGGLSATGLPVTDAAFQKSINGHLTRIGANALGGSGAGIASAESHSLMSGNGFATTEQVVESAAAFAVTGGALDLVHIGGGYAKEKLSTKSADSAARPADAISDEQQVKKPLLRTGAEEVAEAAKETKEKKEVSEVGEQRSAAQETSFRQGYHKTVAQRSREFTSKQDRNFSEFQEQIGADTISLDTRLTNARVFLDSHPGTYLDAKVQHWSLKQRPEIKEFIQEYYADNAAQKARLQSGLQQAIEGEIDKLPVGLARTEAITALERFQQRVARDGLTEQQLMDTMRGAFILHSRGYSELAVQSLMQAADPRIVVQGTHPTCVLNSLEVAIYAKHPDRAVSVLSELMLRGSITSGTKFKTAEGEEIVLDGQTLKPEAYSLDYLSPGGRSYASQLFQMVAANVYWQPRGVEYKFFSEASEGDQFYRKDVIADITSSYEAPGFYAPEAVPEIVKSLALPPDTIKVVPDNFASQREFEEYFRKLKPSDFPVLLSVDGRPIASLSTPPHEREHCIPVLGLDTSLSQPRLLFLDNWTLPDATHRQHAWSVKHLWHLASPEKDVPTEWYLGMW